MGHWKAQNTEQKRCVKTTKDVINPLLTPNFYTKLTYFDRVLIHVEFSSTKDLTYSQTFERVNTRNTLKYETLIPFWLVALTTIPAVYLKCFYKNANNDPAELNNFIMSSLVQIGDDSELSANLVEILNCAVL